MKDIRMIMSKVQYTLDYDRVLRENKDKLSLEYKGHGSITICSYRREESLKLSGLTISIEVSSLLDNKKNKLVYEVSDSTLKGTCTLSYETLEEAFKDFFSRCLAL